MNNEINLENTLVSFIPSFSGNGWETSLVPRFEKKKTSEPEVRITFHWLRKLVLKMPQLDRLKSSNVAPLDVQRTIQLEQETITVG